MEAQKSSKTAKVAYEKFAKEADAHAKEIEKLLALKDEKYKGEQTSKSILSIPAFLGPAQE